MDMTRNTNEGVRACLVLAHKYCQGHIHHWKRCCWCSGIRTSAASFRWRIRNYSMLVLPCAIQSSPVRPHLHASTISCSCVSIPSNPHAQLQTLAWRASNAADTSSSCRSKVPGAIDLSDQGQQQAQQWSISPSTQVGGVDTRGGGGEAGRGHE
jgi:hypothetical protein